MASSRVRVKLDHNAVYGIVSSNDSQEKLERAADAALQMQRSLVPVDTGNLRNHLGKRRTPNGLGWQVGAFDVDYAAAVEAGHETEKGTWVPAQPYIRPSIDAVRRVMNNG